jgi:glycine rich protein
MVSNTLYDSLVIGGAIELWGPPGGVPSINPMCPGAIFRLAPGWNLDAPQPTTDFIASLIVDGERPFGDRASDRTITLPVYITAPDFRTLAGARELLLSTVDAQQWPLTWTRASTAALSGIDPQSYPLILDCFRAQPAVIDWGGPEGFRLHPAGKIALTFQSLPYGRSDAQQQVAFLAPIASLNAPAAPPSPIVLDAFTTINSPQCQQSNRCVVGPYSCYWDPGVAPFSRPDGQNAPLIYSATFSAAVNLTGMASLGMWLGFGSRYYFNHSPHGRTRVVIGVTLTDTSGNTLQWSTRTGRFLPVSQDPQNPVFGRVTVRIPQNNGSFNYAAVASYSLTIINRSPTYDCPSGELRWTCAYLDNLTAFPPSQLAAQPSPRGNLYTLYGVVGTHRAPTSMQFQQAPAAATPTSLTTAGTGTYTVPSGAVYLKVECVGGGGAGSSQTATGVGGGGGGAEYAAEQVFPATPGQVISYSVGAGGTTGGSPTNGTPTTFGPAPGATLAVTANGGFSAAQNSPVGGLGGAGSVNTLHNPGGQGRTASGSVGGGGGSSGGSASPGLTPTGTAAVLFTTPGSFSGGSGWLCPAGVTQVYVECWGGGGSGGDGSNGNNGTGGGGGEYAAQYVSVTPGNHYTYVVAAGGALVNGNGIAGNNGGNTTFTGDGSVTITAHGGVAGQGSGYGSLGGTGSSAAIHFNGGQGGPEAPYSGSGGSSAGSAAAGNAGNGYGNATSAPTGGGAGGTGSGATGNAGGAGTIPGGGGGGTYYGGVNTGAGAGGQVRLTYPGGLGAPTNTGATAVTGGGAGGAGGPSSNTAGSAGSQPGGGGGGADSGGSSESGGAGGTGKITVTPFSSPTFKTLIVHRPSVTAPDILNPFVPVGNGLVAPGTTEYPVPASVAPVPLNQNSMFSSAVTPWTAANSATLSQSAAWLTSGTALFTGNGSTANPGMASETTIPVTGGLSYTAQATCYSPQGFTTVQVIINWFNSSSVSTGSPASSTSTSVPAVYGFGTTIQVTGTAPNAAAYAQVVIQMTGTPANTVQMFADNALLMTTPLPAIFAGTYTVMLIASSWNNPSASRTLSVTVKQYEYVGGSSYTTTTTPISIVPNTQVTNGIVNAGTLTLPLKAIPADNVDGYFTVLVSDTNGSDRFFDCLFLDTQGQSVIINEPSAGYVNYYLDEPDSTTDLGLHLGSQFGRPAAISVMDACTISGGPLTLEPGTNALLAYCQEGAPAISVSYWPRWFAERLE